jgi:hypothetical protein
MFIELLVVGAILMYLYSVGFLDFGSPYAILISVGIVLVAGGLGFLFTHFVARRLVDGLFGFDAWSPRKRPETSPLDRLRGEGIPGEMIPALERLTQEIPRDAELSRKLCDQYMDVGMVEKFVAEKLRILEVGKLSREEICSICNRLADVFQEQAEWNRAVEYLHMIEEKYPDSVEAHNASRRIEVLLGMLNEEQAGISESEKPEG